MDDGRVGSPHPETRNQDKLLIRGSRTKPWTRLSGESGLRRPWGAAGRRLHRRPGRTVANSAIANLKHGKSPQGHSLPQSRVVRDERGKGARGRQATK